MGRKLKYSIDMDKVTQAANDLVAIKGTTIIPNKEIRKHCYTYGLDDYSIWRTFLVKANRTDVKAVYDISSLVDPSKISAASVAEIAEVSETINEITDEDFTSWIARDPRGKIFTSWIDPEETDEDEDEDFDESKTHKDFESEFFEDNGQFDAMDFIGDAYNEYANSMDMGDY